MKTYPVSLDALHASNCTLWVVHNPAKHEILLPDSTTFVNIHQTLYRNSQRKVELDFSYHLRPCINLPNLISWQCFHSFQRLDPSQIQKCASTVGLRILFPRAMLFTRVFTISTIPSRTLISCRALLPSPIKTRYLMASSSKSNRGSNKPEQWKHTFGFVRPIQARVG